MTSPTQQPVRRSADPGPPPEIQLLEMVAGGLQVGQIVYAFVKHGIPDHLANGPRSATEVADAAGVHGDSLRRLLRSLTGLGLVTQVQPGRFALTPLGSFLTSDNTTGLREGLLLAEPLWLPLWSEFANVIATGKTGTELAFGTTFFEWLEQHPEEHALFVKAMNSTSFGEPDAVADAYDFSDARRVVDIGGGNGTGIAAVLRRYPAVEGVLFDLPSVIEEGGSALGDQAARCELVGGDFFDSVTADGDVYVLSHVIHDWDQERCITILRNCREAMAPGGRILIIEAVIPVGDEPHRAKMLDMAMLTFTGGMERTEEEYRDLLGAAGLRLARVIPTRTAVSIVEGVAEQ
jgi:SAM-dependent methyltransferase